MEEFFTDIIYTLRNTLNFYTYPKESHYLPLISYNKKSWEDVLLKILLPLSDRFSKQKSRIYIESTHISNTGMEATAYEAFARTFFGFSLLTELPHDQLPYITGIITGTNKNSYEYWGKIRSNQVLVENAFIIQGLLLNNKRILNKFNKEQRKNIFDWIEKCSKRKFQDNNYLWFKILHYLYLENESDKLYYDEIVEILREIDSFYLENGWYSDGYKDIFRLDYYSAWSMCYYPLMFSILSSNKYDKWKDKLKRRSIEFINNYINFFNRNTCPPPFGRSQIYRYATVAPFGLACYLNLDIDIPMIKQLSIETINHFLKSNHLTKEGIMKLGFYDGCKSLLEPYSGSGSPYWSLKAFTFLLMPNESSFWKYKSNNNLSLPSKVYLPEINCISFRDKNNTFILNGGISSLHYSCKYNKFAFSNNYYMNLGKDFPVDNNILFKKRMKWLKDRHMKSADKRKDGLYFIWRSCDDIEVSTKLSSDSINSYIAEHDITSEVEYQYAFGGFPITNNNFELEITSSFFMINNKNSFSRIELLNDMNGSFDVYKNSNIINDTVTPYFKGKGKTETNLKYKIIVGGYENISDLK